MGAQIEQMLRNAVGLMQQGKADQALDLCRKALKASPNFYPIHNTMGMIFLSQNQSDKAVKSFKSALKSGKSDPVVWGNYAMALNQSGQGFKAQKAYESALALQPENPVFLTNLADCLIQQGTLEKVEGYLQKAISLYPNNFQAFHNLGIYYEKVSDNQKAEESYQQALTLNPKSILTLYSLGDLKANQDEHSEALILLEKSLQLNPRFAKSWQRLGRLHIELGDMEKAQKALRHSLTREKSAFAFQNLALINAVTPDEDLFNDMINLVKTTTNIEEKYTAAFALAYILDKHKQYKDAFHYLEIANAAKRKAIGYKPKPYLAEFDTIKAEKIADPLDCFDDKEITPVFIVGMPRSGTTLVEQILSASDTVYCAGESYEFIHAMNNAKKENGIKEIGDLYYHYMQNLAPDQQFFTNKLPENFKFIGRIKSIFPKAKIIHCKRNPLDTFLSIYMQNFAEAIPYCFSLTDILDYYARYRDLMDFWSEKYGDEIYEFDYEKMIDAQEEETRRLLDYCSLPFDQKHLEFYKSKRIVKTASFHQVRNPITGTSVNRWKNYEENLSTIHEELEKRGLIN